MIQSVNNKKIKEYAKLIQKKERDKTNLFLVEGEHMVKEAFNANALQELFILEGLECPIEFNYETVTQQVLNGSLTVAHSQNSQMSFMYGFFFVKFLFLIVVCVVIVI